jgi:8-oxo-dGTP pyrophosphatase MutT (NUDIX family)
MVAVATIDHRTSLRRALDPDPRPVVPPGNRLAAVLALVIETPEPALLFTERSAELHRHPGEVSFPGGLQDAGDADLLATALREAHEEIGLQPSLPDVLGALPSVHTVVSSIVVTPFVGAVAALPSLTQSDAEIARILTVPIPVLAATEERRVLDVGGGRRWTGWIYPVAGTTIWGATGAMLHALLELLRTETSWTER